MQRKIIFISVIALIVATIFFVYKMNQRVEPEVEIAIASPVNPKLLENPQWNIIINAVPKSGSAFISKSIQSSLNVRNKPISNEYIPSDHLSYTKLQHFYVVGGHISKQHFEVSRLNMQILKRFTDRIVLNVRDPREILLSWVHHLNTEHKNGMELFYFDPEPNAEYFTWSLEKQIDWNIEHFLPATVKWLQDWAQYKKQQDTLANGFQILVTKYEELLTDELALYRKILKFYGIPEELFNYQPVAKTESLHFRKGDPNEWRSVFTEQQKIQINKLVPQELLDEYGWQA